MSTMAHPYWPVFDIRLTTSDLTLRPMTEADLDPLADIRPADVESDPRLPDLGAGAATHQSYWSALGSWRPDSWRLPFVVHIGQTLAGVQELEAEDFAVLRTVDSSSWLVRAWRGQGHGKAMRLAVLALAFDALGAEVAETSAWCDNVASLAVSRALGYNDNGVRRHAHGDRVDDMRRLRMTRTTWLTHHAGSGVRVEGVDACRRWFGI
jgi:RimJ/RimL family protein N-acetyltransferase